MIGSKIGKEANDVTVILKKKMKIIINNEKLPKMKKINVMHEMEIFKILFTVCIPIPFLKILTK